VVEIYPHTKLDGNRKKLFVDIGMDGHEFQSTRSLVGDDLTRIDLSEIMGAGLNYQLTH